MYVCCFCKRHVRRAKAVYCVPEGYPTDKSHEGKPLCSKCGSRPKPSLDDICEFLDHEKLISISQRKGAQ